MEIKGYITNLGKYNEGYLIGEWITFPISDEELQEVYKRIGISDEPDAEGNIYEEVFFTDWELPEGMDWTVFGEYPSIEEVNEVAERLEACDDEAVFAAIVGYCDNIDEALELIESGDFSVYPEVFTDTDLGYALVDQVGDLSQDAVERYFDYEAFGRDLRFDLPNLYEDEDTLEYYENMSDQELGETWIDEVYGDVSGMADIDNYFDYEAFGRDARLEGNFIEYSEGMIELY